MGFVDLKPKMKIIYPFIVLILLMLTFGCGTPDDGTDAPAVPDETATATITSELSRAQVDSLTQTPTQSPTQTATHTPVPTASPSPSPTPTQTPEPTVGQADILLLEYCQETESEICVGSFLSQSGKLGMVLLKPDNQDASYILFDEQRYACLAVTGFTDRYFCSGLPVLYYQPVLVQIFVEGSAVPLAEGYITIQPPAAKPTPPEPYTP